MTSALKVLHREGIVGKSGKEWATLTTATKFIKLSTKNESVTKKFSNAESNRVSRFLGIKS